MYEILDFFKRNKYHFIGWAIFIAYEIGVIGFVSGDFGKIELYLLYYFLNILLFYVHALIILPLAFKQPKRGVVIGLFLTVLECIAVLLIIYALVPVISNSVSYERLNELSYFILITGRCVYFIGFSSTYYLFRRLKFENIRNMELEKARFNRVIERKDIEYELVKSNYAYLRAQINPHFLFNLLNFLYDKARKNSIKAADAMHILSEMMQYSLRSADKEECVLVSEELKQVKNLIYLNQLRFDNKLRIDLSYSKEILDLKIIPLVLLTLVENMFKHGDLISQKKKASIHIYLENDMLYITTLNALGVKANGITRHESGLGNVRKRLMLVYDSAVSFKCSYNDDNSFSAHVSIPVLLLNRQTNVVVRSKNDPDFENGFLRDNHKTNLGIKFLFFFKGKQTSL